VGGPPNFFKTISEEGLLELTVPFTMFKGILILAASKTFTTLLIQVSLPGLLPKISWCLTKLRSQWSLLNKKMSLHNNILCTRGSLVIL
jgi:hypothetical protein